LEHSEAEALLRELLPLLKNMEELYRLRENSHHTEGQLYAIKLIELYLQFVSTAGDGLRKHGEAIRSRALSGLRERIREIEESAWYMALRENTKALSREITRVKCITVGMNLDETFSPVSFGVLGFHSRPMESGGLMERVAGASCIRRVDGLMLLEKHRRAFEQGRKALCGYGGKLCVKPSVQKFCERMGANSEKLFPQEDQGVFTLDQRVEVSAFWNRDPGRIKKQRVALSSPYYNAYER
jgi:hypothetical protein